MTFAELGKGKKNEAIQWAIDSTQEIYDSEGIDRIVKPDDEEVIQLANDREYEIEEEILDGNLIQRLHLV